MRKISFLGKCEGISVIGLLIRALTSHASPPAGFTYLQWADEFNGSTLDVTKWNYRSAGAGYLVNNVAVSNGCLYLTETTVNGTNYGGQISTYNSFNPTYGYYESSMQSAQTNATVSAFWIQTQYENNTNYNPATNGVEMDIIENRPYNNSADNALHWNGYGSVEQSILNNISPPAPPGAFHVYGMLWSTKGYTFYVDGAQVWQTNAPVSQRAEFIDLLIRSTLTTPGGYGTNGTTNTQACFDYVRYYPLPLTWDANPGTTGAQDGGGTWASGTAFWNGAMNVTKDDSMAYSITFGAGGTAGAVNVTGSPLTGMVTFNPVAGGAYTLQGTGSMTVSNGVFANASANISLPVTLGANQTWAVATGQILTVNGSLSGGGSLTASGGGELILAGTNSYIGPTIVSNVTLMVNGSLASASPVTVMAGATLGGRGAINGTVAVSGSLTPGTGTGVGSLATGGETWSGGGSYAFALSNPTNSSGWDGLNINGSLNVLPLGPFGGQFTIKLVTLGTNNQPGALGGFASWNTNVWTIATASGGFLNFSPSSISVDATTFSNVFTGSFQVATNGNSLMVVYTPAVLVAPVLNKTMSYDTGGFKINFSGRINQAYRVLATTNMTLPWTNWLVLTNDTFRAGSMDFMDSAATNQQEFYRIVSP